MRTTPALLEMFLVKYRAVDFHSFFAAPDRAFFLNEDTGTALKTKNVAKNYLMKSFLYLK